MELLIDTMPLVFQLTEDKANPGKFVARGQFARSDRPTANKRLYGESLWNREIGRLIESMKDRRCYGELDHPQDGKTKLQRVSHLLTNLKMQDDGQVVGEAEILDTPNGRILKTIIDANGKVGVSSRGFGSTKRRQDGVEEVQEDFRLQTFDFVVDPAMQTAYPKVFREEREKIEEADVALTLEMLKKDYPGLVEEIESEAAATMTEEVSRELVEAEVVRAATLAEERTEARLRERFGRELRRHVERIDESAYERARSELLSDPDVAASKQIVERIAGLVTSFASPHAERERQAEADSKIADLESKLAERELEVQAISRKLDEMSKIAKKAAYQYHAEAALHGDEARDTIIKLIGDMAQYESTDEIDERIEAVRSELNGAKSEQTVEPGERDEIEERIKALEAKLADASEKAAKAEESVQEANERTKRAMQLAEQAQVAAYAESVVGEYENSDLLRVLCEGADSSEAVDAIVAEKGKREMQEHRVDTDEANRIRAAIARGVDGHAEEIKPIERPARLVEEIGIGSEEFRRLAGL